MRKLVVRPEAESVIYNVAHFIESRNLSGSSDKWVNEIFSFFFEHNALKIDFPLCKNPKLAKRKLSCIVFKSKWIIAFKTTKNTFTVHEIIYGSKLK